MKPARAVHTLLLTTLALVIAACAAPRHGPDTGAQVRDITTTLDEDQAQIEVLVRTHTILDRGREAPVSAVVPEPGVNVTLTGPRATGLALKDTTGRDGFVRFNLAESLSRLDALRPGTYRIRIAGVAEPREVRIDADTLNRVLAAGEARLRRATGPSVGEPRALIDARFHPPGEPTSVGAYFAAPPAAGDTVELSVIARNVGNGTLYRLIGTVSASGPAAFHIEGSRRSDDGPWFEPVVLEFGRLAEGERSTLSLQLAIPRSSRGGDLNATIAWTEFNNNTPAPTPIELPPIGELERPAVVVELAFVSDVGEPLDASSLPVATPIQLRASVSPFAGAPPSALILRFDPTDPTVARPLTENPPASPADPDGPTTVALRFEIDPRRAGQALRLPAVLIDADFGSIWRETVAARAAPDPNPGARP
jgi:hypothetical protein